MVNEETDVIFPPRLIPALRGLRGGEWNHTIDTVAACEPDSLAQMAFLLLMVNLGGCNTCSTDTFRGMKGCLQCSKQTIKRFRGDDEELHRLYQEAKKEVIQYFPQLNQSS